MHILIVGDEPSVARIIQFKLEREGHRTSWLQEADGLAPDADLVVVDSSPEIDLAAVVSRFSRTTKVLVLTELHDGAAGPLVLAHGAAAVLGKPFRPTQLARLVRQLSGG
jgi:DNA-binding response OmpR family regulator